MARWKKRKREVASQRVPQRPGTAAPTTAPIGREAERLLSQLRDSPDRFGRHAALFELLRGCAGINRGMVIATLSNEIDEPDPDLRCWRLARALSTHTKSRCPEPLAAYGERQDLAERILEGRRNALKERLLEWADRASMRERSFRLILSFEPRSSERLVVRFEIRGSSPRRNDEPRTLQQVKQVWSASQGSDGTMSPQQRDFLDWIVRGTAADRTFVSNSDAYLRDEMLASLGRFSQSGVITWSPDIDPALAAKAGIEPGAPVVAGEGNSQLVPACVSQGPSTHLELRFVWPDGRERRSDDCVRVFGIDRFYSDSAGFVISDGELTRVLAEPPSDIVEAFTRVGGTIPLFAEERHGAVSRLAVRFPHLERTLAAHTHAHRVTPVVALDLRDDDWMQIRVFAVEEGDDWSPGEDIAKQIVFEHHPDIGWMRLAPLTLPDTSNAYGAIEAEPAADPQESPGGDDPVAGDDGRSAPGAAPEPTEIWAEAPDPAIVAPVLAWVAGLNAGAGTQRTPGGNACEWRDHTVGWWLYARNKGMTRFADEWQTRPPHAHYYGTENVRNLLARGRRVVPRLRIQSSGIDWFEVSAEWLAEGLNLSDADLAALRKATTPFVRLSSGWVRREQVEAHEDAARLLADLGLETGQAPRRLSVLELAGADARTLESLASCGADDETLTAVRRLRDAVASFEGIPAVATPASFRGDLRPYQKEGLDFLSYASALGLGVILADDMGLGKTVQTLAWLQSLRDADPDGGPSLVICPASVVHNWVEEAAQFTPELRVLAIERGKGRRALHARLAKYDLIVTNYTLARLDAEAWSQQPLRALILDEAQNVKNPDAAITRVVSSLEARHRVALTGTPLENRALDLWSIGNIVNPGHLGTRADFSARFDGLEVPPHRRAVLAAKLRPILLRRTKAAVAPELPERIEESRRCEMTKGQHKLYLAELARSRGLVEELSGDDTSLKKNKIEILAALTRLRQICCHPALAGGRDSLGSGKFDALDELLEPLLEEGHKVLVFSQFVRSLALLRPRMARNGIRTHVLTGQTTNRRDVVAAFEEDAGPSVFLISLKAGGTGLNLTSASYVVLMDPWWNPAVEAQAIDRTHRIGQDRTVIAYRLITEGTIEEKIRELQKRKEGMIRDVLGESGFARTLTRDDLAYILDDPAAPAPRKDRGKVARDISLSGSA